jgi:hypothetical protein
VDLVAWLVHGGALMAFAVAGFLAARITFRRRLEV